MTKPTFDIKLDLRPLTTGQNEGRCHIKLWVTFIERTDGKKKWKQRPYKTHLFCSPEEFDIARDKSIRRVSTRVVDIRSGMVAIEAKASHIINELGVSDQKSFENLFLSEHEIEAARGHFEIKIQELANANKISSKEKYITAINSFEIYFGKGFTFDKCTPDNLQAYEDWYIAQDRFKPGKKRKVFMSRKKSLTSVGINMRCLRHIFKRVIRQGIVSATIYPFGLAPLYVIPEGGSDTKKFLENESKNALMKWEPTDSRAAELFDYARFSYYGSGMNMSDVARLRKPDLEKEYLSINRQKTKGRKKKAKKLIVPIHPAMREIIQRRGNKDLIPDGFVFPILNHEMDEETRFYRIRRLVDDVNEVLARAAKELNLEFKPTSYTLRHTFSFNMMQMGATTEELQDALAHGSVKTTEAYKHGFSLEKKKKFSEGL
jgi:integrase